MAASALPRPVAIPPGEGAYLTDGRRMAQVCCITQDGRFVLEDCAVPIGEAQEPIMVSPSDLMEKWLTVEAWQRGRRERRW